MRAAADFTEQQKSLSTPEEGGGKIPGAKWRRHKNNKCLFLKTVGSKRTKEEEEGERCSAWCVVFVTGAETRSLVWAESSEDTKLLSSAKFTQQHDVHRRFHHNPTPYANLTLHTHPAKTAFREQCVCVCAGYHTTHTKPKHSIGTLHSGVHTSVHIWFLINTTSVNNPEPIEL